MATTTAPETITVEIPRDKAQTLASVYRIFMEDPTVGRVQAALVGSLMGAFGGDASSLVTLESMLRVD